MHNNINQQIYYYLPSIKVDFHLTDFNKNNNKRIIKIKLMQTKKIKSYFFRRGMRLVVRMCVLRVLVTKFFSRFSAMTSLVLIMHPALLTCRREMNV